MLMNIEDFDAYKLADDIKKKHGIQACNNYKRCMLELRVQSENSFLLSELDNNSKNIVRIMIAPDGTPTIMICTINNRNIYVYSVHNYSWKKELIADIKDFKAWEASNNEH